MRRILLRLITGVWAIFLGWMMLLQFDDPDAAIWIALYGIASALCFLAAAGVRVAWASICLLLICVGWAIWLSPNLLAWMADHSFAFIVDEASVGLAYMEKSRESLGLLIAAAGLGLAWSVSRGHRQSEIHQTVATRGT